MTRFAPLGSKLTPGTLSKVKKSVVKILIVTGPCFFSFTMEQSTVLKFLTS